MEITKEMVARLEDLAAITLTDDERARMAADLQSKLDGMSRLGTLDTTGVAERSHAFDNVNALREDEVRPSFARELILRNATVRTDDSFVVPRALD